MEIKLLGPVVPVGSNLGVAVKWNMNMLPASCLPEVLGTLGKMELLRSCGMQDLQLNLVPLLIWSYNVTQHAEKCSKS